MRRSVQTILPAATALVLLCQAGESGAQPVLATGPEAEVTADGLHKVDPSIMDATWVKPDLDLSRYTRIFFMPTVVLFREVGDGRYYAHTAHGDEFPVSDQNRDLIRTLFGETFHEYVAQVKPYEMSDDVGREVLMVQGFLLDVISGVPPDVPGGYGVVVRRPWEADIILELRDSMSNAILARTMDRQFVDGLFDVAELPRATRITMQRWSGLLRGHIKELLDLGGGRWSRCQLPENDCGL